MAYDKKVSKEDYSTDMGCTACIVLITPEEIYCSNAGDSRGVLSRGKKEVVALSYDHKPSHKKEIERIKKA
jgi:serine/threonine protein phosphatase PrpC